MRSIVQMGPKRSTGGQLVSGPTTVNLGTSFLPTVVILPQVGPDAYTFGGSQVATVDVTLPLSLTNVSELRGAFDRSMQHHLM